jgi:hypothetical protein
MQKPSKKYKEELVRARPYEIEVEEYFKGLGYKTELYLCYDENGDETYQTIVIEGKHKSHPDIRIESNNGDVVVKYLIEVKSQQCYYANRPVENLEKDTRYFLIDRGQFENYKEVEDYLRVPVYCFFIDKRTGEWYNRGLKKLDKTKISVDNAYFDEDEHYAWDLRDLKRIK